MTISKPSSKKISADKWYLPAGLILSLIGFVDSTYLSLAYFRGENLSCTFTNGCEKVTTSAYSVILGTPLALIGLIFYALVFVVLVAYWDFEKKFLLEWLYWLAMIAFGVSLWLTAVQVFALKALCQYCLLSATTSTLIFGASWYRRKLGKRYHLQVE